MILDVLLNAVNLFWVKNRNTLPLAESGAAASVHFIFLSIAESEVAVQCIFRFSRSSLKRGSSKVYISF